MSNEFTVISADVFVLTTRIAQVRITEGPKFGQEFSIPRAVFQDPDLIERGDDEICVATWWAIRNGLDE